MTAIVVIKANLQMAAIVLHFVRFSNTACVFYCALMHLHMYNFVNIYIDIYIVFMFLITLLIMSVVMSGQTCLRINMTSVIYTFVSGMTC